MKEHVVSNGFARTAKSIAHATGRPLVFCLAVSVVVVWAITGPLFGFSDTWQLVINTGTSIITFMMVFLIQNTQNRDTEALQLKLDELIRALDGAQDTVMALEEQDDEQIEALRKKYARLARLARRRFGEEELPASDEPVAGNEGTR